VEPKPSRFRAPHPHLAAVIIVRVQPQLGQPADGRVDARHKIEGDGHMYYTETAAAVAAEVLTLINNKPRTLSQEELAAVIARALAGTESANHAAAYRTSGGRLDAPDLDAEPLADTEAEHNGIDARLYAVTDDIISRPVRTLDDLVVRAVIVKQWLGDEIASPEGRDGRALAALVRGVFDLAGRAGCARPDGGARWRCF
jgi:hypothetical protein